MATSYHNIKTSPFYSYFLFILLLPFTNPISFEITHFDPNDTSIIYEGGAVPTAGNVEFTNVDFMCQVGRATYVEKVPIWNSKTKQLSDFTTHFSFFIDIQGRNQYGSGLAFFLAPVGSHIPLNSAGGFFGLYNFSNIYSYESQIVHIEFDSYFNREWDPLFLHVGINNNSLQSAAVTRWNARFHTGDPADVWITYNATTKNLSLSWKYQTTSLPEENTSLSLIIDLTTVLPEWVAIGFSASTSNRIERHVLQSWKFNSTLEMHEEKENNSKKIILTTSLSVTGGFLLVAVGAFLVFWMRKKKREKTKEKMKLILMNDEIESVAGPRRYSYEDLVLATNNFSRERRLGRGGFGAVYKGYNIHSGKAFAVKKITKRSNIDVRNEYMAEVKIISQLRHRNLVPITGWCHEKGEFLLVYEFMPNGSLDSHLFKKKIPLTWTARYRIALGLANALLYLHEGPERCVLHRDIKASNIMLDSNVEARLGDFGLALFMEPDLGPETRGLAGTNGYMAPEYIRTRRASKESDVYSFGLVALEIVTGRMAVDPIGEEDEAITLVRWVWDLYETGELNKAVDGILTDFDETQVKCLLIVGLWCAYPDKNKRPSIMQAIQVLEFKAELPNLRAMNTDSETNAARPSISFGEPAMSHSSFGVGR
ncbi:L-type lectin-domain containing receptor kinase IX.1 [Manihot esculenta]|uniref:Protein kinase domain-containing protein n=1 Tax=Manihot esculenta TaxID=3983 RepID=A0A2C9UW09_MANES|nr:L-type lectin-domain containing receptor kinase IX.1 [Manihot esculenta]OAY35705.1 hypothetical protein MANES_12G123300v8 [Manihot esculenta]